MRSNKVFFEPAMIHHNEHADRANGWRSVADPFLHPDHFGAMSDRVFDDEKHIFGLSEDIREIDGAGYAASEG